jgi:hypothetical protein
MKTLVITAGETPIPPELEQVIRRGSTAVDLRRASDVAAEAALPRVDRVVFWSPGSADAPSLRPVLDRVARAERNAQREVIVFVSSMPGDGGTGLSPTECFVWPQDRDRLTMAFLTGA